MGVLTQTGAAAQKFNRDSRWRTAHAERALPKSGSGTRLAHDKTVRTLSLSKRAKLCE
ncbi:hypothetical protein [Pseudomarimonas arenosa]|uniref:Transposase n=1 Tax=Pseudomarimonas arenosa TaxID=2774145 RepID=A0AAW3ZSZ4_9GAMM|nr:hypothetical protein [Pseudomarimonas arenosa]MBD8527639.1 hypothetical protein [Pseudomarimonas arenosa]